MPVPSSITDLSTVAADNSPPGTESAKGSVDNYFRAHASFIKQNYDSIAAFSTSGGAALVGFKQSGADSIARTVEAKQSDTVADADFSTLASAINAVGATPRKINMGGRTSTQTSTPTNTYGVRFDDGKVLAPSLIAGHNTQINTYADDVNGLMIGRENMAAFMLAIGSAITQNVYIYGDSTVQMDAGYALKSHDLVKLAMYEAGINWCETVNRGVSGTSWSDLSALTDLGASTKLIVIKYGINDAVKANALATFAADARSKLTAIRAHANGGFSNLSILLMGPNSTYRPSQGQDAKWYEDLRNIYLQLCKEFDCAYFDTYAYLQQTRRAPGLWMDNIASSGEGLHPSASAAYWVWYEGFKQFVFGDGCWNPQKSNHVWNRSAPGYTPFPTTEPYGYPFGVSIDVATTANGWPFNGILVTHRHALGNSGNVVQQLLTLDTVPRRAVRTGSHLTWTQWTGVPIAIGAVGAPAFQNSWANKGGGYASAGYQVGADGFVELYGVISGGTAGAAAFTLPAEARPASAHIYYTPNSAVVTVFGGASGAVVANTADNTLVSLDGIRFKVL